MKTRIWREQKDKRGVWRKVPNSERVVETDFKDAEWTTDLPDSGPRVFTPYSKQGPPLYVQHRRAKSR